MASAIPPAIHLSPPPTGGTRPPSRLRCAATSGSTTTTYWAAAEAEVEAHLGASIPTAPPPSVRGPFLRLVSSAPRTMAPALCVAACELVGGRRQLALGAACALRLLHSAFHAHRPLLGLPGPAACPERDAPLADGVRLLTADGLLPLGFQLVADSGGGIEPGRVLQVMAEISEAAGAQGMAEGEYEEILHLETGGGGDEAEWMERVCRKTEGKLYACAGACGAILGGAGGEETEKLRRWGMYVGTLHGLLYGGGFGEVGREERAAVARELRSLALSEMEGFHGDEKDAIVGLVDVRL
uniref:Heterodimeric geranylgeranyl pyrophosphate synthase small subunit, chloroplastic n=1 Tax=Anthurium amnicola TaxID=1678845 RepID=A0A1D1ZJ25_9ARAE